MRRLGPKQLRDFVDDGGPALLLDVREPWEWNIGHIEGSINVPMQSVPDAVQGGRIADDGGDVVVICHHGARSLQVAHYLESVGFERVINLEGGIDAWSLEVDPATPRY